MELDLLVRARREAERAVEDMPDGELRIKAFEVILARLIAPANPLPRSPLRAKMAGLREGKTHSDDSIPGRILALREEGFFQQQRGISEIKAELSNHGWHIPITTLSGRLQGLVQHKQLRRERVAAEAGKKSWRYSNP